MINQRLIAGEAEALRGLLPETIEFVLRPYVGEDEGGARGRRGSRRLGLSGACHGRRGTLGPLPAGRHGFSREQVAHNQRERLIAGLATAVAEHGYNAVTITHITKAGAGLPPRLLRQLRGQGGVLPRRLRGGRRPYPRARRGGRRADARTGPTRRSRPPARSSPSSPPSPTWPASAWSSRRAPAPRSPPRFHDAVHELVPPLERGRGERSASASCPRPPRSRRSAPSSRSPAARSPPAKPPQLEDLLPDFAEFILSPYLGAEEAARLAHAAA